MERSRELSEVDAVEYEAVAAADARPDVANGGCLFEEEPDCDACRPAECGVDCDVEEGLVEDGVDLALSFVENGCSSWLLCGHISLY